MITDISYLEAGFSEEFSSLLNGNNEVENLNEGMFSKLKSLRAKSNGRKSNYKFKGHCDSHKKRAITEITEGQIKNRQRIFDSIKKQIKKSDIEKIIKKYPLVAPMFTFDIDSYSYHFTEFGDDYISIINIDYWDHPEAKSKGRLFYKENDIDDDWENCADDLVSYLQSKLSDYGKVEWDGDWDTQTIYITVKHSLLESIHNTANTSITRNIHGSVDNDSYIYAGAYNSYLESSIDNELRLNAVINSYINEEVVLEARIQDDVAKRWDAFLKFMDGILDRFWSAMDKIVNSQKSYLEKYQDIILKKKPKEQITYSYTGDYTEGADRCLNTALPSFNYEKDAPYLRQDGFEAIVGDFMSGKNFKYNKDEDLAVQFKNWFIAAERGETKGKLSNLNMQSLYDFIYKSSDLQNSIKRDRANLSQSRNSLINAVNKELREKGETTQQNQNGDNTTTNTTTSGAKPNNSSTSNTPSTTTNTTTDTTAQNASTIYDTSNYWMSLTEADDNGNTGGTNDNKDAGKTGLNIQNNTPEQKDANGNVKDNNGKPTTNKQNSTDQDIKNIVGKWITVSRSFCTGKLTAVQQISKDYMSLIKEHVKSYGGKGTDGGDDKNDNNANAAAQTDNNANNKK